MYFHYVRHSLRPSEWHSMGAGEKIILRAFMLQEIEIEQSENDRLKKQLEGG